MKYYCIDCETAPNPNLIDLFNEGISAPKNIKDPEKIKANIEEQKKGSIKDMSVDIDFSEIVCIGVKEIGEEAKHLTLEEFDEFIGEVDKNQWKLITYNGKNFDIPILIRALIKKGLTSHTRFLKSLCNKYNTYCHIDLIEELNNYGKYKSLDKLYRIYLGTGKEDIDFATASKEEILKHNLECLSETEQLFNLFKSIF